MCMRVCVCVCMCVHVCVHVWISLPLLACNCIWFMYVSRHECAQECMYLSMRVHVQHSHSSPWELGLRSLAMHDGYFPTVLLLRGLIWVFSCVRAHRVCKRVVQMWACVWLCATERACTINFGVYVDSGMREWLILLCVDDLFLLSCRSSSRRMQKQTLANMKNTAFCQTRVLMKNEPYILQTTRKKRHETRQLKRVSSGTHPRRSKTREKFRDVLFPGVSARVGRTMQKIWRGTPCTILHPSMVPARPNQSCIFPSR